MLIRLNKDSFIRFFDNVGYIRNQHSDKDLVYNETGQIYLRHLSREPQEVTHIVSKLQNVFNSVSLEELQEDFIAFVRQLSEEGFLSVGNSIDELDKMEKMVRDNDILDDPYPIIEQDLGIVHSSAFLFKIFAKKPHLFNLQIETTSKCNERCIHCYIPMPLRKTPAVEDLSLDEIKSILSQAKNIGTLSVTFSGGELLLRQDLFEILQYARECDMIISLFSNVTLLTKQMVEKLKDLNIASVQVSLYSMDSEIHDSITGLKGSCEKTKHGIDLLTEAGIRVVINCPVIKTNKDSVFDVQAFAKERNIKFGSDYLLIAQSDFDSSNLDQRLNLEEIGYIMTKMMKDNESYRNNTLSKYANYDMKERIVEDKLACGVGLDTLSITANGDIIPCPGWNNYVLGNIRTDKIDDVWRNSNRINYLRGIKMSEFPKCVSCENRKFCSMCLLRNFNESNGNLFCVPKVVCQVSHLRKMVTESFQKATSYSDC